MEFLVLVALAGAIAAFAVARGAKTRADRAHDELQHLQVVMENLARSLAELRKSQAAPAAAEPEPAAPPAYAYARSRAPEGTPAPEPVVTPPVVAIPPPVIPIAETPQPAIVEPSPPPPLPPAPAIEPPIAAGTFEATEPAQAPEVPPPPPPFQPRPKAPKAPFDWESLIGVKLFSWIAGVAFALAAIYFLRYSVENGWLTPSRRAAIGITFGTLVIIVCEMRIARGFKVTANAMHGAGVATLYATLFAAYARWHLVPALAAFGAMILVTAVAVWLSIRRESVFIALLGLIGGFATPALLSTGENKPIGLFTYLLLLNVGLAWVAMRRRWTVLTAISLAFTVLYQWGWISRFLTVSQLPLAAGVFLVFAIGSALFLWLGRRGDGKQPQFDVIAVTGATLPLLFAVFAAAVPAYGARYNILFGFLLLVAGGLAAIAVTRGPEWLHLLGGGTTLLVFILWRVASFQPAAWPAVLGWIVAFVALYLGVAVRWRTRAVYTAPLLLFLFPTFVADGNYAASPGLLFTILFILLAACAAYAITFREGLVYYVAAFFALTAEAIWSGRFLTPERLLPGLGLYAVFALFFLGVPLLARRLGRKLEPRSAFTVLVLLSITMLFFLGGDTVADSSLWGLTLLLAVLNTGALFHARTSRHPLLSIAAAILSWLVIGVWWSAATITAALLPAVMVVGGFGVLVVVGNVWAARDNSKQDSFEGSTYLALAGHLFLLFVATQKALAIPPWPLFGVLALLALALGTAALWLHRARLFTATMAATQLVLLTWTVPAGAPWSRTALTATVLATAFAMLWHRIDRGFGAAAIVAAFAGQLVAVNANASAELWLPLLLAHTLLLVAILAVAWIDERHWVVTLAAVTTAVAIATAPTPTAADELLFALVPYALFLGYPLLLGRRAKSSLHPYLAAVIGSGVFFGFAYDALVKMGYKPYIGALPVVQAILMLVVLARLLQIERDLERLLSRLALVAAAVLGFLTLAIPLQLDKEWITLGWALEGAAVVWLFTRIPHRGLLLWGGALLGVAFVRLTLNPALFLYHPRSSTAIVNWYLYAYLVAAAAMFMAAYFMPRTYRPAVAALNAAGTLLLFWLLNIEIADFYSTGSTLTFNFFSSSLAQDLTYTISWGLFAVGVLLAGILLDVRAARIAAISLLAVTIAKCFLHDLARLGGLYRVASLLGLAASLVIVGMLLQKFVLRRDAAATPPEAPAT
jgi:uncharacterized membrane protein